MGEFIKRNEEKNKNAEKYSPALRTFALTLRFYSSRAYDYVRRVFNNLLPAPSTLRAWYKVVDGRPGYTKEALDNISAWSKRKQSSIPGTLIMDEIYIRKGLIFKHNRNYGFVNLGTNFIAEVSDTTPLGKSVLVFMFVPLTFGWKIPVAYFIIDSLSAKERANLLEIGLQLLHDANAEVCNLTFDGTSVNLSMCKELGADFRYGNNLKPWIIHPSSKQKIFTTFDPCHMLKLVRNAFADCGDMSDGEGQIISWSHIQHLHNFQTDLGLKAANKLGKKHINFEDNKMNVRIAAQTLSDSVACGLTFINEKVPTSPNMSGTSRFCRMFNNIFDMLNCRSKFTIKPYCEALSITNEEKWKNEAKQMEDYILGLKIPQLVQRPSEIDDTVTIETENVPVLNSLRKTGFLGFIIDLRNAFEIWEILKKKGMEYLLTYKMNQDPLETFFSSIRSRGGWNNNPNAYQFEAAYRMLLIHNEVSASHRGNISIDDIQILSISSATKQESITAQLIDDIKNRISEPDNIELDGFDCEDDFDFEDDDDELHRNPKKECKKDIIKHISGYVSRSVKLKTDCEICNQAIINEVPAQSTSSLTKTKNRGKLTFPSEDVFIICNEIESIFNKESTKIHAPHFKEDCIIKVFKKVGNMVFNNADFLSHSEDHRVALIVKISATYIKIRLHHEGNLRIENETKKFIRQKCTKLVLFTSQ